MKKPIEITSEIANLIANEGSSSDVLNKICNHLKKSLGCNIVSIYRKEESCHRLIANAGFSVEQIGELTIQSGKGLVHHITNTVKPLCLRDATSHLAFYYVHGLGEEKYHGFIGVPVLRRKSVIGVLAVQYIRKYDSSLEDIALMETVAQQISGIIVSQKKKEEESKPKVKFNIIGRGVVPGIFHGKAIKRLILEDMLNPSTEREGQGYEIEKQRLDDAHSKSKEFLEDLLGKAKTLEMKDILTSHLMMITDPKLLEKENNHLRENYSAEQAVSLAIREISDTFENISDPYIRQRSLDVVDVGRRLYHTLRPSEEQLTQHKDKAVYIASKLPPSVLIEEGLTHYGALILVDESLYSHNIILAKSMGIPTIIITREQLSDIYDAEQLFVDGEMGMVVINPTDVWIENYMQSHSAFSDELSEDLGPPSTRDGRPITLGINGGFTRDIENLPGWISEIGLFRTEFQFFLSAKLPTEEELTANYTDVLSCAAPRMVTLRILDTGGDKQPPCMHFIHEDNPILGDRSIRFLLKNSEIIFTQLRAMLKAQIATKGKLRILIPMVSVYEEVSRIRDHVNKVIRDLKKEGKKVKRPPLGVMIEVPSSINLIPKLAPITDYFCVGTNDLLQYFVAADRTNSNVQYLYRWHHPSFLTTLRGIIKSCLGVRRPVSICGEMAGELWGSLVLVGLGYENLSMDRKSIARHHEVLSYVNSNELARLVTRLIQCDTSLEVLEKLQLFLDNWKKIDPELKEVLQTELNNLINPS